MAAVAAGSLTAIQLSDARAVASRGTSAIRPVKRSLEPVEGARAPLPLARRLPAVLETLAFKLLGRSAERRGRSAP